MKDLNEVWPEKPKKTDDHALDALRYGVMSLEKPTPKQKVVPWNSLNEIKRRAQNWRKEQGKAKGLELSRGQMRIM